MNIVIEHIKKNVFTKRYPNGNKHNRVKIIVPKKFVLKATKRNKIRRQIRSLLNQKKANNGDIKIKFFEKLDKKQTIDFSKLTSKISSLLPS